MLLLNVFVTKFLLKLLEGRLVGQKHLQWGRSVILSQLYCCDHFLGQGAHWNGASEVNGEGFPWWGNSVSGEQDPKCGIMNFCILSIPFLWFQFLGWCRGIQLPRKSLSTKWATTVTCQSQWHQVLCSKFSCTKNNLLRYFCNILRWALEKNVASVRINFKIGNIFSHSL